MNNTNFEVYQIHRTSGSYDTYHDRVIGTFLSKEKAEMEKLKLEEKEAEMGKCRSCPLRFCHDDCNDDCAECNKPENKIKMTKKYCNKFEQIAFEDDDLIHCKNENFYYDESTYRIEAVTVIV